MAFSRSEVVLSTDPRRLVRVPRPGPTPAKEVIRSSPPQRPAPRTQAEWHDVFRGDE